MWSFRKIISFISYFYVFSYVGKSILLGNIVKTAKIIENEVFDKLEREKQLFAPLIVSEATRTESLEDKGIDGFVKISYLGKTVSLIIEIKSRTAPQIVEAGIDALLQLTKNEKYKDFVPTLIVPYLTEKIVNRLKSNNLCGLDLNGNYFIAAPEFLAIRLDRKNQYKESVYIKDIYSRNSSLVGRFLLRKNNTYEKVSDIYEGIKKLEGNISLSTVSKVLKGLEEQLIISRENKKIKLLQPDKLLKNLKENYIAPSFQRTIKVNLPGEMMQAKRILFDLLGKDWIWAGESCAEFYASTTPADLFTVYSRGRNNPTAAEEDVSMRFYNYKIFMISPVDEYVFFDSKDNKASAIQAYLELSQLDKREKEIARDIERDILNEFGK